MPEKFNPGFSVFDPDHPEDEYLFTLTPEAAERPFDDAIDYALMDVGADLTTQ